MMAQQPIRVVYGGGMSEGARTQACATTDKREVL